MSKTKVMLDAACDEVESFQVVVVPKESDLKGVVVKTAPLIGANGSTVPVEWNFVEYVKTGPPRAYASEHVGWWPDILMPAKKFDVKTGERQPVWIRVTVPPETVPGKYSGNVTVRHGELSVSVPVELRVRNFRIPRPGSLVCPFGLYASSLSKWYYGDAKYLDKMSIDDFARWCEFMGQYRLTPKNISPISRLCQKSIFLQSRIKGVKLPRASKAIRKL